MKYRNFTNKLMLMVGVTATAVLTSCEQEFYQDEQYRKEIYIVSGEDNIFPTRNFAFGGEEIGYLSVYASGTTPIEKEVMVELERNETVLSDYNQKRYGDNYKNYVLELPDTHYKVDDWSINLYPNANSSYSLFPIKVNIDGLEPEDNYFLPLRIASVSDYMISSARRNVLMQILMKNDYATTKEKSYYTMNGTRLRVAKDTWEPLDKKNNAPDYKPINATKLVAPVTEYGIRILTGSTLTSDRKELRKQGIVVTVHPEEMIDVPVIGSNGLPTGEYIQCQKVTLDKWYNVNSGITVLNIEDTPSYYNPEKKEFTLNYRYNYNSNDWYEMKEVMSPVAIANEILSG